jgi:hypothetical protein
MMDIPVYDENLFDVMFFLQFPSGYCHIVEETESPEKSTKNQAMEEISHGFTMFCMMSRRPYKRQTILNSPLPDVL